MKQKATKKIPASPNLTKDIGSVVLSIIIAIILARTGILRDFLFASQEREIFGIFLAGLFFTSIFTAAPATVILAELAEVQPVWELALLGGLGAVLGDYVIFQFIKDRLSVHISRRPHLKKMAAVRWLVFALGALVLASPLPDELGLTMMGLGKMKIRYFVLLSFALNSLGILIVGFIGKSF